MKIIVKNYTVEYYNTKRGLPVEVIGKFVQLVRGEEEHIVFSPKSLDVYHANIIERYLFSEGCGGSYNPKHDEFTPDGNEWKIIGGGHWRINSISCELELGGQSMAYGRFDSHNLTQKLLDSGVFSGYRVRLS